MIRLHEDWGHHVTLEAFHDISCEVVHAQGLLWDSRNLLDSSRMSQKERRKSRVLRVLRISKERCLETKAMDPKGAYGPVRSFLPLWTSVYGSECR